MCVHPTPLETSILFVSLKVPPLSLKINKLQLVDRKSRQSLVILRGEARGLSPEACVVGAEVWCVKRAGAESPEGGRKALIRSLLGGYREPTLHVASFFEIRNGRSVVSFSHLGLNCCCLVGKQTCERVCCLRILYLHHMYMHVMKNEKRSEAIDYVYCPCMSRL